MKRIEKSGVSAIAIRQEIESQGRNGLEGCDHNLTDGMSAFHPKATQPPGAEPGPPQ